jgi:hypothetical protein
MHFITVKGIHWMSSIVMRSWCISVSNYIVVFFVNLIYCIVAFNSYHMSGVIALISGVISWFVHVHVVLGAKAIECV